MLPAKPESGWVVTSEFGSIAKPESLAIDVSCCLLHIRLP